VASGITTEQRRRIGALPRGRGLLGLIVRENRAYRIPDIAIHPDSAGFPADHPPMRSFLGVPITVKGRSVGNFYLTNKHGGSEFAQSDQRIVEMFALHAGVAIENARLHEQVERMAVVEERERIGRDLHDGIIQSIYAVGLSLEDVPDLMRDDRDEAIARVDRAIDALNIAITDIRNFIFGLRPELAEQHGLLGGLAAIADEVRLNTMIDVELHTDERRLPDLPVGQRAELLQIAREALSNMARHSRATRATVLIEQLGDRLQLIVSDNGRGFDATAARPWTHQGLSNMRARAEDLGGTLTINSEAGRGTRIIVRVPTDRSPIEASVVPAQEGRP
jgi:signal transduction histidine kinase